MKLRKLSINTEFELYGNWYFSKELPKKFSGVLTKNSERITLKIYIDSMNIEELTHDFDYFYGMTEYGELITCRKLVYTGSKFGSSIPNISYVIQEIYVGDFIDNNTQFNSITLSFDFLNKWIKKGIRLNSENKFKDIENYPKDTYIINQDLKLQDSIAYVERLSSTKYEYLIEKNLKLSFINTCNLSDVRLNFYKINLFLNIFFNKFIVFNQIYLVTEGKNKVYRIFNQDIDKKFHDNKSVIYYEEFKSYLESSLTKWFSNFPKYYTLSSNIIKANSHVYDLKAYYAELIRNFETYHREFIENNFEEKQLIDEDKKKLVKFIESEIENNIYFMDRIKYTTEKVSFRERIESTLDSLPDRFKEEISNYYNEKNNTERGIKRNIKSYTNFLTDFRNDYIHNNVLAESEIFERNENLFEETAMLKKYLRYLILFELGIHEKLLIKEDYYY